MDEKQRKKLAEKIEREHKKDFEALNEFQALLANIYSQEELKLEDEKTRRLWEEIGEPDARALFTTDIHGYFLQRLYSIDPILRKFILYVSVEPEVIDIRAKIAEYITREDIAEHIFYKVWYCFAMLQFRMGSLVVFDIVNALLDDYDYFEYVDTYWLICKIHGKKPPSISELRQKLRREQEIEDAGRHVHEKKRGTLTGATLLRTITEGDRKRYELEVEFLDEKNYKAVDDDFVDGFLCGGIALSFPNFSDRLFSQGEQPGTCDRLIIKCKGNSKEFDLSLLDKYKPAVLKNARKYSYEAVKEKTENADRQTSTDSDNASQEKITTPEIEAAMAGLADAARNYDKRKTTTLSGHLLAGIKSSLSDEWKAASTTQDYERRLEGKEYQLKSDGITSDSKIWEETIEKFKQSRGRVSKSRLESSGGNLDSEIQSDQGFVTTFKDLLPSENLSPEEMMLRLERERDEDTKHENLMTLITKKHPGLILKLMSEEALTSTERKQLQRLRKNKDLIKLYEKMINES